LYTFFSTLGDLVDLNLDYYPDKIITTFTKHSDVLRILDAPIYIYNSTLQNKCPMLASKIDFVQQVRNCENS